MPGTSGFSGADRGELLRLQVTDKPHCGRKRSGLELGELDLQVADKPLNLAHARSTMLCIHLIVYISSNFVIIIIIIYSCCCRSAYAIDHAPTDVGGACKTSSQRTRARTTRDHTILITIQFLLPSLPYQ